MESRKSGKKDRKHGRNKRKPGAAKQTDRTMANKIRRIKKAAKKSNSYQAVGFIITRGAHGKITVVPATL